MSMAEKGVGTGEKTCPYCAETIKAAAVVCKHCGKDLSPPSSTAFMAAARGDPVPVTVVKPKSFKWWLWVPLGIFALVMLNYAVTPQYEIDARASRRACEQLVKQGLAMQYQCDAAYADAIANKKSNRDPASRECPAEAQNCSWSK